MGRLSDNMLRFSAGIVCGWIAARSLPPAPLAPPTFDELTQLTITFREYYDKFVTAIQDSSTKK
tara:strand:+ start:271 stop:462 length:192 start_codon:yes stop_codon:yes gene_type:complete